MKAEPSEESRFNALVCEVLVTAARVAEAFPSIATGIAIHSAADHIAPGCCPRLANEALAALKRHLGTTMLVAWERKTPRPWQVQALRRAATEEA